MTIQPRPEKVTAAKAAATKRTFLLAFTLATLLIGSRQGCLLAQTPPPSRADQVAAYFKRPVSEINALRSEGYGYGEIVKILVIAQMSKRPVQELLARNRQGYGWGTICVEQGLNPVVVKERVDAIRQELHIHVRPA